MSRSSNCAYKGIWRAMIRRCTSPTSSDWPRYGGRGITVCERWLNSYADFESDMGVRLPNHSIDRINVDGNYEPSNCRWATPVEQARNRHDANTAKTHCPHGHPYDETNTYVYKGERHCRTCRRAKTREWRDQQRGGPARPYGNAVTHCAQGHEYTPSNTGRKASGARRCKECAREYSRNYARSQS